MAAASAPTVFSSPKFRYFDGYRMNIENAKRFFPTPVLLVRRRYHLRPYAPWGNQLNFAMLAPLC